MSTTDDIAAEVRVPKILSGILSSLPGVLLQLLVLAYYAGSMSSQFASAEASVHQLQTDVRELRSELSRTREELAEMRAGR